MTLNFHVSMACLSTDMKRLPFTILLNPARSKWPQTYRKRHFNHQHQGTCSLCDIAICMHTIHVHHHHLLKHFPFYYFSNPTKFSPTIIHCCFLGVIDNFTEVLWKGVEASSSHSENVHLTNSLPKCLPKFYHFCSPSVASHRASRTVIFSQLTSSFIIFGVFKPWLIWLWFPS